MLEETGQPNALECVYSPLHFEQGYSMVDTHKLLTKRYGIKNIILHPIQGNKGCEKLDPRSKERYRQAIYDLSVEYGSYLILEALKSSDRDNANQQLMKIISGGKVSDAHCGLGVHTITIKANGEISPCYTLIGNDEFSMGHIDSSSNSNFSKVEKTLIDNKKSTNPVCSKCSILETCHSCPGDMLISNGKINSPVELTCNYLTGVTEGRILGLDEFRANSGWSDLISTLKQ
jgi:uncharacterized protein